MLRDCSANGMPWTVATGFDGSAIIGDWMPVENLYGNVEFGLDSNGSTLYTANVSNMIIGIDRLISYLSHYFTLKTGDLLFTCAVSKEEEPHINDFLEGYINGVKVLECRCK
jgi:2-keto-4-pentenoate hydratase/2-oxohepta-3-ene-1,7-dioic acid hydratase in catechol pathway